MSKKSKKKQNGNAHRGSSSETNAYYVGVGYAKRDHGEINLGFGTDGEHAAFERGANDRDKHFVVRQAGKTLLERISDGVKKIFPKQKPTQRLHVKRRARLPRKRNR